MSLDWLVGIMLLSLFTLCCLPLYKLILNSDISDTMFSRLVLDCSEVNFIVEAMGGLLGLLEGEKNFGCAVLFGV